MTSFDADAIVIYASRKKMLVVLLGSLALAGAGVWIGCTHRPDGRWVEWIGAVVIGVPLFAAGALFAARKLLAAEPAVIIDSRGIEDRSSGFPAGPLRWDEIDEVVSYSFQGQRMLGIVPVDVEAFLASLPRRKRWVMRANMKLGCPPINVPQIGLPITTDELLAKIEQYRAAHTAGA